MGQHTALNLHLSSAETQGLAGRSTGISLRVPTPGDLSRLTSRLREKGMQIGDEQLMPFHSGNQLKLRDPAGNLFTLIEADEFIDHPHMFQAPAIVTVGVSKLRQALDFYVGRLEVPMVDQLGPNAARLMNDGTHIILEEASRPQSGSIVRGDTGICLGVNDPQYVLGQLEGRGLRFKDAPVQVGNTLFASLNDPDGNTLTLMGAI